MHFGLSHFSQLRKKWLASKRLVPFNARHAWRSDFAMGLPEALAKDLHRVDIEGQQWLKILETELRSIPDLDPPLLPATAWALVRWGPLAWKTFWLKRCLLGIRADLEKSASGAKKQKKFLLEWVDFFDLWAAGTEEALKSIQTIPLEIKQHAWTEGVTQRIDILALASASMRQRFFILLEVTEAQLKFSEKALLWAREAQFNSTADPSLITEEWAKFLVTLKKIT